jgi:uncharacterized membrane protein YkgB
MNPLGEEPSGFGINWMERFVRIFFRYSLALIFIWFGALKIFGVSPAYELVTRTFSFFPPHFVNLFLGWWELTTGILFLFNPLRTAALILMALQIPGTFLPLFIVPEMCFVKAPWILTTNGEFILKNLLIIGAGLLIGGGLDFQKKTTPAAKILT